MSLLGFDMTGTATINGLTEINANNVWSDVLYYDAGTVPVNVKTAIDGITVDVTALEADVATLQSEMNAVEADVATLQSEMNAVEADVLTLQGEMNAVEADVATLQGEMNAVEADVATLQGEMNDVEADVATLQGEMNDVEADVAALIISTGVTAATVAGLVISQVAQDVTIASHTVSIAALQLEDLDLENRIVTLEVKTSDQSWGAITGTTFATKVNVGGGSGVVLNTAAASEFNSGLQSSSVEPLAVASNLAIGATQTSGTLNFGTLSTRSGDLNFGTGASAKQISINSAAGTNTINGTTTIAGTANINTTSLSNTNIGNGAAGGNFTVNAAINSITGTTNTLTSTELLATAMTFTTNTNGSDLILSNATSGAFSVGGGTNQDLIIEATGTGTLSLEVASANKMVATSTTTTLTNTNLELTGIMTLTGAQARPIEIGTYSAQSSYSTTTITPVTTYLGGTLESTKTFTNSATGNFRYIMASVTPFNVSGAITLTAGTYMFWLAINFEDGSVFNLTDLTMGLTTISTLTSGSSEATIVASLPNLTCFFHKTDAGDAAASDSEQRVLSSCFRLAASTTVYPFYFANHSVTVDSVTCNTVFVKIGSA
jgi:uncharacterized coiled-coil protein SlyX